jgi:uncharacterized protein YmfQ (DUF2313 family)
MSKLKSTNDFLPQSEAHNVKSWADLFPTNKKLWSAYGIPGTNAYKLLAVFSQELSRLQSIEYEIATQYIPNLSNSFITEWNQMLGIPDDCFSSPPDDETQRLFIYMKLFALNLQTVDDYVALAALLGIAIQVFPYTDTEPFVWTIAYTVVSPNVFPYTFTFRFTIQQEALFECLVNTYKPAHTLVNFIPGLGVPYLDNALIDYVDNAGNVYLTNLLNIIPYLDNSAIVYLDNQGNYYGFLIVN